MKNYFFYVLLICTLFVFILFTCTNEPPIHHEVKSEKFPELNIEGFKFPEDSTTINTWIHESDMEKIYAHGWGIWTGLTSYTKQYIPGDKLPLRVFETWLTPKEMISNIKKGGQNYNASERSNRANLSRPNQFNHRGNIKTINDSIHESVSYSPAAAKFAIDNKIFLATTLLNYAKKENRKEIPFFPNNAITIKPVFKLLQTSSGQKQFNIAAWNGTTDNLKAFPEQDWDSFVTVDINENFEKKASVFGLSDFIHYKLNDEDAHFFNKEFAENEENKFNAKPGDIAILVGMHVGTREITNWTWQTFWWDANADNPPLPSSKEIASYRPKELKGAARHYAMSSAYYMVNPNEPYNGNNIIGEPNYAFNPYLEAGFGPNIFDKSMSYVQTKKERIDTYAGVRTNCMSCHRMATVSPDSIMARVQNLSNTPYVGNSFISRSDSIFKKQLLLDFAWSIEGNVDTLGLGDYIKEVLKK